MLHTVCITRARVSALVLFVSHLRTVPYRTNYSGAHLAPLRADYTHHGFWSKAPVNATYRVLNGERPWLDLTTQAGVPRCAPGEARENKRQGEINHGPTHPRHPCSSAAVSCGICLVCLSRGSVGYYRAQIHPRNISTLSNQMMLSM